MPLLVKIYKLLINELNGLLEEKKDEEDYEDEDEEGEEEDEDNSEEDKVILSIKIIKYFKTSQIRAIKSFFQF